jgi:hypothetical protein
MKALVGLLALLLSVPAFAVQTALTAQTISETAYTQALTTADPTNGNSVVNPNGDLFFVFNLSSAAPGTATATINSPNASYSIPGYGSLTKTSIAVSLALGDTKIIGPFQTRPWNNSSGLLILSFTGTGSGSVALKALKLDPTLRR